MRNQYALENYPTGIGGRLSGLGLTLPRRAIVGAILMVALFAFEIFNFDTTRYALTNLMGDVRFLGFQWAAILAIAFCSIDFAGLVRLFTPEKGKDEPKEIWYLMGAWLLGATMNALMTWWAVSLTLLNHEFGNEVMSREQLLEVVPVFVAVLVWLTRILFIGAFTVAGEHIFDFSDRSAGRSRSERPSQAVVAKRAVRDGTEVRATPSTTQTRASKRVRPVSGASNGIAEQSPAAPVRGNRRSATRPKREQNSRIKQRPPMPSGMRRMPMNGVQAKSRTNN
jgi:hypothetical protein